MLLIEERSNAGSGRTDYIPSFDGLRTISITAVIIFHVVSAGPPWLQEVARRGWYGVDVFFVLSGFLITWIISSELEKTGTINLPRFYARRALRLQPAYFSGLLLTGLLTFFGRHADFPHFLAALPFFLTYSLNLAVAVGLCALPPYGIAWSLCIEEQFYLTWAWVLRRLGPRGGLFFAFGAVALVAVYRTVLYVWLNWGHLAVPTQETHTRLFYGTDVRLDTIFVGCALALAVNRNRMKPLIQWLRDCRGFPAIAVLTALAAIVWGTGGDESGCGWRCFTLGFTLMSASVGLAILSLFLQQNSPLSRCLSWRPIVFVGKISYGVYLFHMLVWQIVGHCLEITTGSLISVQQELAAVVLVWTGSVAVAWLHYSFVERRFLALRGQFSFDPSRLASGPAKARAAG